MSTSPTEYVKGVGPAAPSGSRCACGSVAIVQCQGCGATLCSRDWWRHGTAADPHRMGDETWVGIRPAAVKGGAAQ